MDAVNEMQTKLIAMNQEIFGLAAEQKGKQDQIKIVTEQHAEAKEKIAVLENRKKNLEEQIEV